MAKVIITGGTGLIGKALSKLLVENGYQVIILSRRAMLKDSRKAPNIDYAQWDIDNETIDASAIRNSDYIIHLAGAGVADKRWTSKRKKEIRDSRKKSSELLLKALQETPNKIKAVISASAIGWYGADPSMPNPKPFIETDASDLDFLGETCKLWEESISPVTALGKRLVILRTGIVLSNEGGAFKEFKKPVKFGIAAILGNGKQAISWLHIDDLCRIYLYALENTSMHGSYNAVAPKPVSNREFTIQLAKVARGSFYVPLYVPGFLLRLVMGEMSKEVLKSTTVSCEKIRMAGFDFIFPSVESALGDLVRKKK
ncbi:MAG: TIGR01777 family oxidoreductase [Chitinophagaceae bacterium]